MRVRSSSAIRVFPLRVEKIVRLRREGVKAMIGGSHDPLKINRVTQMYMNQNRFLHKPADSVQTLDQYIHDHRSEGEQLDFKGYPGWNDGSEAAKDVAAFANHLGGDIVIGIVDVDGFADHWLPIPNTDLSIFEQQIFNWLRARVYPREFSQSLGRTVINAPIPDHSALVISVPPSPDLVGIEKWGQKDGTAFKFPIRNGKDTRWMVFEEVMHKMSITTRRIYIRLMQLQQEFGVNAPIYISSPVTIEGEQIPDRRYVRTDQGIHCELLDVTEDALTVRMRGLPTRHGSAGRNLTIPLEFVEAVWSNKDNPSRLPQMAIALNAEITWNQIDWILKTWRLQ